MLWSQCHHFHRLRGDCLHMLLPWHAHPMRVAIMPHGGSEDLHLFDKSNGDNTDAYASFTCFPERKGEYILYIIYAFAHLSLHFSISRHWGWIFLPSIDVAMQISLGIGCPTKLGLVFFVYGHLHELLHDTGSTQFDDVILARTQASKPAFIE